MRGSPTPGYLGTPLAPARNAVEQADLLVKAARLFGATDEEIAEASMMAALAMAGSTFLNAHQVDHDTFRRETLDAVVYALEDLSRPRGSRLRRLCCRVACFRKLPARDAQGVRNLKAGILNTLPARRPARHRCGPGGHMSSPGPSRRRQDAPMPAMSPHPDRRTDLDWLRVMAVLIVLFFHTGMMFVPWSWHVKSPERSLVLEIVMLWLHVWRMPLLLFVSGAGTYLALRHRSALAFLGERHRRLLVPLVFGCFVIVPPQIYMERIAQYRSFWEFYPTVFEFVPYPRGGSFSYHHLWFVLYLLVYSIALLPLLFWLRSPGADSFFDRLARIGGRRFGTLAWLAPLVGSQLLLGPWWPDETHGLTDDLASLMRYGLFFLAGYLFARDPRLWEAVRRERRRNLAIAALTLPVFYAAAAMPARPTWFGWDALYGIPALVVGWATLLAIAGSAQVHLTRGGPLLRYATEAVYPFYILHQTVIVVLGYHVVRWRDGLWGNYFLICGGSFVLIMAAYHLVVRPFALTRLLFGLKPVPRGRPPAVEMAS